MHAGLDWSLHPLAPAQGLGAHRDAWDALGQRLLGGHGMLDGRFVDALLRHFGERPVLLAVARSSGEPVAMLLLNGHASRLGVWASFLPSQTQIGPSLVPAGFDLRGLFAALPGYATEVDLLCNDPRFGDLRELPSLPTQSLPHALTMAISLTGRFDDYWAQRPKKMLQNMRRYQRQLDAEAAAGPGGVRLDVTCQPEAMAAAVARYAALESSGWKGREGTALRSDNAQGRFYAEVMQTFAARGEALVYELWLGEELLASRLLLALRNGMVFMLKTAFQEQFKRLAPGRILLQRTLESLFERMPGGVVEFYTDADADLLAWSTSQRWIHHVGVYRHHGLPTLYGLLRGARGLLRRERPPSAADLIVGRSGASVERFGHVRELPADAVALLGRMEQQHVEFGADWFANLADTVFAGGAAEVCLHVLRRQGQVLAVLPTVTQTTALGREVGAQANFYTALFAPALAPGVEAEDLLPLTQALRQGSAGAAAYRFAPMDPAAREFTVLAGALRAAGLRVCRYFAFGNWHEPVQQDWAGYLESRDGQLRATLRRKARKFAAEGGRLEVLQQPGAALDAGLLAYQAVYATQGWKRPEPYPGFVPGLARLCAQRGWLRFGLAWLGDKPVAAQLWIVANGRADIYKLAYDEAHKALAPGTLLTAHLMAHALDVDRVREVDYLIGDDPYKAAWMSRRRERWGLVAYDPATLRGLAGLVGQRLGDLWRRLRPTLHRTKTSPRDSRRT